mgnify:CR=1 FL=1
MTVLPCYGLISQKNSCHSFYLDYRCEQPQTLIHVLTFILLTDVVICGIHSVQPDQTMILIMPPPPIMYYFESPVDQLANYCAPVSGFNSGQTISPQRSLTELRMLVE